MDTSSHYAGELWPGSVLCVLCAKYFFLLGDGLIGRCSCLDVMAPREDVLAPLEDVMALGVDVMAP